MTNIGNKKRGKIILYVDDDTNWRSNAYMKAIIYNNNFILKVGFEHDEATHFIKSLGSTSKNEIKANLDKRRNPLYTSPIVGGWLHINDTIKVYLRRALGYNANKVLSELDKRLFAKYLLENVHYYGKIDKIIELDEQLRRGKF